MSDVVGGKTFIDDCQVFPIPSLIGETAIKGLDFFGGHGRDSFLDAICSYKTKKLLDEGDEYLLLILKTVQTDLFRRRVRKHAKVPVNLSEVSWAARVLLHILSKADTSSWWCVAGNGRFLKQIQKMRKLEHKSINSSLFLFYTTHKLAENQRELSCIASEQSMRS